MKAYIWSRLLQFIPTMFGITLLAFALLFLAPGDPATVRVSAGGITPDPAVVKEMQVRMGLDKPFFVQYASWLGDFLTGDAGTSYVTDEPVSTLIVRALPYTVDIALLSMMLTLIVSVPVGLYSAAGRNTGGDYLFRGFSFVSNAVPNFMTAMLLLFVFSYRLNWIPVLSSGRYIGLILPTATLTVVMSARYIRQVRAAVLDELEKPYVAGLRSRGVSERNILYRNVLKNVMMTVITLTGVSVGSLLGGTVIVETVFNRPGLGMLLMDSISSRDYPTVQAVVVWLSAVYMLVTLAADISYRYVNPKLRKG